MSEELRGLGPKNVPERQLDSQLAQNWLGVQEHGPNYSGRTEGHKPFSVPPLGARDAHPMWCY